MMLWIDYLTTANLPIGMKMRKFFLVVLVLLIHTITVYGQFNSEGPALIKDKDGYTNVRSGAGTNYAVVDTLFVEDFFFYKGSLEDSWVKVVAWKGRSVEGFVHSSRVQLVRDLPLQQQEKLLTTILTNRESHARRRTQAFEQGEFFAFRDSEESKRNRLYHDSKYDPMMAVLPGYFCQTKDVKLLQVFLSTLAADEGSANELPPAALGNCFKCAPDLVMKQVLATENPKERELLLGHLEFGISDLMYTDRERFQKLQSRIENAQN